MLQTASTFIKRYSWLLAAAVLLACSGSRQRLPYYNTPDFTPLWPQGSAEIKQQVTHRLRSFSLLDQDSNLVTEKTLTGKIHIANFIFTTCSGICPVMTSHFRELQDTLAGDTSVLLLSYSVTPWIDSVPKLKKYAQKFGVDAKQWRLLTGSTAAIYDRARKDYFAEEDLGFQKDSTEFLHTEHFILVDKAQHIRGIYNGTLQLEVERLIADINLLKSED